MSKIFTLLFAMLLLTGINANARCFLIGEVNNQSWAYNVGSELQLVDGSTTLYRGQVTFTSSGYFSVATSISATGWDDLNSNYRYGPATNNSVLALSTESTMVKGGTAWKIAALGTYTVDVDLSTNKIKVYTAEVGSGIYLRGDINGWSAIPTYQLVKESTNVYTLTNVKLQGFYKIADATWSTLNIGGSITDGTVMPVGIETELVKGSTSVSTYNLALDGTYLCSKVTLNLNGTNPKLKIEGTKTTSGIFIQGSQTSWKADSEWEFVDNGKGVYTLENKNPMVTDADAFKIASADWNTYNFGLATGVTDPIALNQAVVLTPNGDNITYKTQQSTNKIVFSLIDNKPTLTVNTTNSVSLIDENNAVKVYSTPGAINVDGTDNNITVYRFDGTQVSSGKKYIETAPGLYIVKADNKAFKVIVK